MKLSSIPLFSMHGGGKGQSAEALLPLVDLWSILHLFLAISLPFLDQFLAIFYHFISIFLTLFWHWLPLGKKLRDWVSVVCDWKTQGEVSRIYWSFNEEVKMCPVPPNQGSKHVLMSMKHWSLGGDKVKWKQKWRRFFGLLVTRGIPLIPVISLH